MINDVFLSKISVYNGSTVYYIDLCSFVVNRWKCDMSNALKEIYSFKCDQQFEVSEHTYLLTYRNTYYWYGINIEILTLLSIIFKRKCLYCPGIPSIQLVLEILVHLFMIDLRSDEFYKRLLNSLVVECWRSRVQSPVKDRLLNSLVVECGRSRVQSPVKDRLLNSLVVVLALSASYQTL